MWNTIVNAQFYDLRVDHDQLDILRLCLIQNAHDQCVDADGFTGTGCAGNQQMRHLGDISHDGISSDILSDREGKTGFVRFKFIRFK